MPTRKPVFAVLGAFGASLAGVAIAVPISTLSPGLWQLHEIGVTGPARPVCVTTPLDLIQLNHPGVACTRFTLDDVADHMTVQYTCQGKGYGRTTITVQEPGLIKLDTQGLGPDGRPFDIIYEGRRSGACAVLRR